MSDPLTYALASLERAAENGYPWSLTPNEAGLLVAEVERLRGERAAVVAWLLERAHYTAEAYAGSIERGEHRREEER